MVIFQRNINNDIFEKIESSVREQLGIAAPNNDENKEVSA